MEPSDAMQALRAEMEREPRVAGCSACATLSARAEGMLRAWQNNAERKTDVEDDVRRLRTKIQAVCDLTGIADPATWTPGRRASKES